MQLFCTNWFKKHRYCHQKSIKYLLSNIYEAITIPKTSTNPNWQVLLFFFQNFLQFRWMILWIGHCLQLSKYLLLSISPFVSFIEEKIVKIKDKKEKKRKDKNRWCNKWETRWPNGLSNWPIERKWRRIHFDFFDCNKVKSVINNSFGLFRLQQSQVWLINNCWVCLRL